MTGFGIARFLFVAVCLLAPVYLAEARVYARASPAHSVRSIGNHEQRGLSRGSHIRRPTFDTRQEDSNRDGGQEQSDDGNRDDRQVEVKHVGGANRDRQQYGRAVEVDREDDDAQPQPVHVHHVSRDSPQQDDDQEDSRDGQGAHVHNHVHGHAHDHAHDHEDARDEQDSQQQDDRDSQGAQQQDQRDDKDGPDSQQADQRGPRDGQDSQQQDSRDEQDDSQPQTPHVHSVRTPPRATHRSYSSQMSRPTPKRSSAGIGGLSSLAENGDCEEDVKTLCPALAASGKSNNFRVLFCLQEHSADVSRACHKVMWKYKLHMTKTWNLESVLGQLCKKESVELCSNEESSKTGAKSRLYCLLDHLSKSPKSIETVCKHILRQAKQVVFSDYRLVEGMLTDCEDDINRLNCHFVDKTPIDANSDTPVNSQGTVMSCLEARITDVSPACQKRLLKKEKQSNFIELDRPLFQNCATEMETLCSDVDHTKPGNMFACLEKNKHNPTINTACRRQIARRQRLIAMDYEVAAPLAHDCKDDISDNSCHKNLPDPSKGFLRLFEVIKCLTAAETRPLSQTCEKRVMFMRKRLMGSFDLSHDLLQSCMFYTNGECAPGRFPDINAEGVVIGCLMEMVAKNAGNTSAVFVSCKNKVQELVSVAKPASNFHIDLVLERACKPVIEQQCQHSENHEGDEAVLGCLIGLADSKIVPPECKRHLYSLQYFLSRDFDLNPQLVAACKDDSERLCSYTGFKGQKETQSPSMILACLYRAEVSEDSLDKDSEEESEDAAQKQEISPACKAQVHQVMARRASSVHLNPALEQDCTGDLGKYCLDAEGKGGDIRCLQENVGKLSEDCRSSLKKWSKLAVKDVRLNKPLMKACKDLYINHCTSVTKEGELLRCLVEHRSEGDTECRAEILRVMKRKSKDVRLNFPFKNACKGDLLKYCRDQLSTMKTTEDAMQCLRDATGDNDAGKEGPMNVLSERCAAEIQRQSKQNSENVELNPVLHANCKEDIKQLCSDVEPGDAKVINCLMHQNPDDLSRECHTHLFKKKKQIFKKPKLDFALQKHCGDYILQYCSSNPSAARECLTDIIHNKDKPGSVHSDITFRESCRNILLDREEEASKHWQLNRALATHCHGTIDEYCGPEKERAGEQGREGIVIACLESVLARQPKFVPKMCAKQIRKQAAKAATDYRLSAHLAKVCQNEIISKCSMENKKPRGEGAVLKCLKKNLKYLDKVNAKECVKAVIDLVVLARRDMHADPTLFQSCLEDLRKSCPFVLPGEGRLLGCLVSRFKSNAKMSPSCRADIKSRLEMWDTVMEINPEIASAMDLAHVVLHSNAKISIFSTFLTFLAVIFLFGCMSGRRCRCRRKRGGEKKSS